VKLLGIFFFSSTYVFLTKTVERLVHLTLRARGAAIVPYPCPGCGVKHREFYLDAAAGGIDGVCEVIEFWLGALGQAIDR
jgi:hypothetical protein